MSTADDKAYAIHPNAKRGQTPVKAGDVDAGIESVKEGEGGDVCAEKVAEPRCSWWILVRKRWEIG